MGSFERWGVNFLEKFSIIFGFSSPFHQTPLTTIFLIYSCLMLSFLLQFLLLLQSTIAINTITCRTFLIPTLQVSKIGFACYPAATTAATNELYPLHIFAHGNGAGGAVIHIYTSLMKTIASHGFVVVAYESCPIDSR